MRLINPNPGECVDRQTILQLKMESGATKGMNTIPFLNEHQAIQKYLQDNFMLLVRKAKNIEEQYNQLYHKLLAVNHKLWDYEDAIRDYLRKYPEVNIESSEDASKIASLGLSIAKENDERARLVQAINKLFGIDSVEKLHEGAVA